MHKLVCKCSLWKFYVVCLFKTQLKLSVFHNSSPLFCSIWSELMSFCWFYLMESSNWLFRWHQRYFEKEKNSEKQRNYCVTFIGQWCLSQQKYNTKTLTKCVQYNNMKSAHEMRVYRYPSWMYPKANKFELTNNNNNKIHFPQMSLSKLSKSASSRLQNVFLFVYIASVYAIYALKWSGHYIYI